MNEVVNEERMLDEKTYWNDYYWKKHLEEYKDKSIDFLNDLWLEKHHEILNNISKGHVLDLGCGLGQHTKYFQDKGFNTTSFDISERVLNALKEKMPEARTIEGDMRNGLPFAEHSVDLVFANLSLDYFDSVSTDKLLKDIHRILPKGGYLMGRVNSSKSLKYVENVAVELEPYYYYESGRHIRLFDEEQFEYFFRNFEFIVLEEITTTRWDKNKIIWEFIARAK